jgi:hypothetical protein
MPVPQELFFLGGWASCPSNKFMKRTFARGLSARLEPYFAAVHKRERVNMVCGTLPAASS